MHTPEVRLQTIQSACDKYCSNKVPRGDSAARITNDGKVAGFMHMQQPCTLLIIDATRMEWLPWERHMHV